jgi:hypothetical protein
LFFAPLVVRPIAVPGLPDDGLFDATAPYGYPSPLAASRSGAAPDAPFVRRAVDDMAVVLREHRIVSAFFRMHPLLELPPDALEDQGWLVEHGPTVVVDLARSHEELWSQTRSAHRNKINRGRKAGYAAEVDDRCVELDRFVTIYTETMRRVDAAPQYFLSRDYFARLMTELKDCLHLCVVRIGGEVAAAGIFSEIGGVVQYHLGGTKNEFLPHHAMKFLLHFVRTWAKDRGNRLFNLGGGLGGRQDSLYEFKAGFSDLRRPFRTWRLIADRHAYQELTSHWERCAGQPADHAEGYFPAYRKPLPEGQSLAPAA